MPDSALRQGEVRQDDLMVSADGQSSCAQQLWFM